LGDWEFLDLGKIAANILASGDGWSVADLVCTYGPRDRTFAEQHSSTSIGVVVEGCFQYRSIQGSQLMSPGSLVLGNPGQYFECGHEHRAGDRCLAFYYEPEFFERAKLAATFLTQFVPAIADLAPWIVKARRAIDCPDQVALEEFSYELPAAVLELGLTRQSRPSPSAADERRISEALRFIEANLSEPLPLERLAANAKLSEFHFLRTFKQVTKVTPHQYILRARLRAAALRLQTGSARVLDVALDAGFGDLSNFNHAFRAEFGVSPKQFKGKDY